MAHVDSPTPLKKDTIYIDVEDDITGVIDKLKNSNEKIVALVPPKGNAVLQSTVNLKLLNRAAKAVDKQPVLVTNNSALMALAGGLEMYVAKNLQSKPFVPSDEPTENEDDAIDVNDTLGAAAAGAAVGTTVALNNAKDDELQVDADELAADLEKDGELEADEKVPADAKEKSKKGKKDGKKVPNFNSFRKKLLIFGALGVALLVALAFVLFKSKTEIVIRAETTPVDIAYEASITDSGTSDPENHVFRGVAQTSNKTVTQDFAPTGEKNVGDKATGSVTLSVCAASFSPPSSVPAGTTVASNGNEYVTSQAASFQTESIGSGCINYKSNAVDITAAEGGKAYNVSNATFSVSGRSSLSGTGSASGGTDKTVTVVSQGDVVKATDQLKKQDNSDEKEELKKSFPDDVVVLNDSFTTTVNSVASEPAVGKEANEGKLTAQVTYTMLGIKKDELKAANEAFITDKMDNKDHQQVYKDGVDEAEFEKVKINAATATYKVKSVGQFGPKYDTTELAQQVANKKVGEVRAYIQDLPGVKSVDINVSPFWASKTPDADRITIILKVDENTAAQ